MMGGSHIFDQLRRYFHLDDKFNHDEEPTSRLTGRYAVAAYLRVRGSSAPDLPSGRWGGNGWNQLGEERPLDGP